MKKILLSAAIPVLLAPLAFADIKLPRVSPKATVTHAVGLTDVTITYSRPGVKGRAIWGGLVPYDQVWRTGANEATIITISQDVKINGKPLPAGTYSLHTIPGRTAWTVIFNKTAKAHHMRYPGENQDELRVTAKVDSLPHVETLTLDFPTVEGRNAIMRIHWGMTATFNRRTARCARSSRARRDRRAGRPARCRCRTA